MTRVLLISGHTRDASLHNAALRTTARIAPPGTTAGLYDGLADLPAFVPGADPPPLVVAHLRAQVDAADAVLFCSPEFAGFLPGSLKNLLDWLVDGGDLHGKPVAWLSLAGPGQDDGARATLETVLGHAGARLLPAACIRLPLDPASVDAHGLVTDHRLPMALLDMLQALERSQAVPQQRPQPSWQAYSSVYPVLQPPPAGAPWQGWPPS
jgi:chromate reductase, NAD(P)H dehydrogenase (quinone)